VLSAKWSHKTTVEYQDYILEALEIGKTHGFPVEIFQGEIWRFSIDGYFRHGQTLSLIPNKQVISGFDSPINPA
jgi:hypothetical protein